MLARVFKRSEVNRPRWKKEAQATVISYHIPSRGRVVLRIFDPSGEEILELVNKRQQAGEHEVSWNGRTWQGRFAPSGVYYYRVFSKNSAFTGRIVHSNDHCERYRPIRMR